MIEVLLWPGVHAVVVNDLKLDYELLTQFSASTVAAQFHVFHSLQQLPALVAESAASAHQIILFCRKPDAALVRLAASGVEIRDLPTLYACLTNSVFIEHLENTRGSECCFPYAPFSPAAATAAAAPVHNISPTDSLSITPALSQAQVVSHSVRPIDFSFLLLHFAKTIHIITLCAETDDVAPPLRPAFAVWDRSASLPDTMNPLMMWLFQLLLTGGERAMVRVGPQLQVVLARFEFLVRRINQFIDQWHRFIQQVLVVIRAIEQALTDMAKVIASTTRQIAMDEAFRATHVQAVAHLRKLAIDRAGETACNRSELEAINRRHAEFEAYREKNGANTEAAVDAATCAVVKAFT
jgi:hypothetical protein